MGALEVLLEEHEIILKAIDVLQLSVVQLENGKTVKKQFFNSFIEIMSLFADKCHHGKEEMVLFPLVKQKDILNPEVSCLFLKTIKKVGLSLLD